MLLPSHPPLLYRRDIIIFPPLCQTVNGPREARYYISSISQTRDQYSTPGQHPTLNSYYHHRHIRDSHNNSNSSRKYFLPQLLWGRQNHSLLQDTTRACEQGPRLKPRAQMARRSLSHLWYAKIYTRGAGSDYYNCVQCSQQAWQALVDILHGPIRPTACCLYRR